MGLGALLGVAALLLTAPPLDPAHRLMTALLFGCAIASELLPIPFRGTGLRVTLSLPFLAGIAYAWGPLGALLAELILAGGLPLLLSPRGIHWTRWTDNLSLGLTAVSLAGLALVHSPEWLSGDPVTATTLFAAVFAAVNAVLVGVRWRSRRTAWRTPTPRSSDRIGLTVAGAVYLLCAAAVGVAIDQRQPLILVLLFVPFVELRRAMLLVAQQREQAYETVAALMLMLRRAHPYSHGHLERVANLAERAAQRLGMPSRQAQLVRVAALLHDIGKIAINERILDKPSRLTPEEFDHVKQHALHGAAILTDCQRYAAIVPWIKWHHERPDGTGYPDGLAGDAIPLPSRIIAVVDAFDAMVGGEDGAEQRPYRQPKTIAEAVVELEDCAGTQFDPRVVQVFRAVLVEEGIV